MNPPAAGACVPAGHGMHDVAPVTLENVPGGHGVHIVEASPLYLPTAHGMHVPFEAVPFSSAPAGHGSQRAEPGIDARWPAAHGWHAALPSPADLPAGHTSHPPTASLPGGRRVPAGHGVHSTAADAFANQPAMHGSQSGDPGDDACVPGSHAVQLSTVDPSSRSVWPAGQGVHAAAPVAFECVPRAHGSQSALPSTANEPAEQASQTDRYVAPSSTPRVPTGQGVHFVAPVPSAKLPAGQGWHRSASSALQCPGGQEVQLPIAAPVARMNFPAGHASQTELPAALANLPVPHGAHSVSAAVSACEPGAQVVHPAPVQAAPGSQRPTRQLNDTCVSSGSSTNSDTTKATLALPGKESYSTLAWNPHSENSPSSTANHSAAPSASSDASERSKSPTAPG